ncbi:S8 family serine peptidase [Streptomyces sp. NBC_01205]|uniref:cyanobactin maturation protease PatG family protein n=1 Tax=Streptomyces sp. NBC_01205 TaxID=2903771 RepID=UPI002E0D12AC|nr:S8 family serine peptidase [Streptomyces sp. NBC_01205]
MDIRSVVRGIAGERELLGSPEVRVAVLDGPVDLAHPCFAGSHLTRLPTLVSGPAGPGPMSLHGTHVTSLLFGHGSSVSGLVPRCTGLLLPVFRESPDGLVTRVPQLDLARAVEQAVEAGAHVINISGGERTPEGAPDSMLERALRLCEENGVLVVAAVGNDGCDCLQAPAATASVLAVGAADAAGAPLDINNWGAAYRLNGVLAPGQNIQGAAPGGLLASLTGSSFAAPAVTGVVALLVAQQLAEGRKADPLAAGSAVRESAIRPPCGPDDAPECRRLLGGRLNAAGAFALVSGMGSTPSGAHGTTHTEEKERAIVMDTHAVNAQVEEPYEAVPAAMSQAPAGAGTPLPAAQTAPSQVAPAQAPVPGEAPVPVAPSSDPWPAPPPLPPAPPAMQPGVQAGVQAGVQPAAAPPVYAPPAYAAPAAPPVYAAPAAPVAYATPVTHTAPAAYPANTGVCPSCAGCGGTCGHPGAGGATPSAPVPSPGKQLIYAIGTIGFDFQTEARRDSFRQQMPNIVIPATKGQAEQEVQPNIYDPKQLHAYLSKNPWASDKLTWTLNADATPLYALEAEMPVGMDWTRPIITDPKASAEQVHGLAAGAAGDAKQLSELLETLSYPPVSFVYRTFRDALLGQAKDKEDLDFVSRVSIPGVLTDRTVRLFSGQVVPVVEVKSRGLFTWNEALLVNAVFAAVVTIKVREARKEAGGNDQAQDAAEKRVRDEFAGEKGKFLKNTVRAMLDKIYWKFRNLGQSSGDRALNAAGTNAFLVGAEIQDGILSAEHVPGKNANFYALDTVTVTKSPFCRPGSDCQDVTLTFFDPENDQRAPVSYLFTFDVSDDLPVSLAPVHTFIGSV